MPPSQRSHPFAPVSILLPDGEAVQPARKHFGDTIGVKFFQIYGLGQQIIDAASLPIFRISNTSLRHLARQILRQMASDNQLTTFEPVWQNQGFVQVLK